MRFVILFIAMTASLCAAMKPEAFPFHRTLLAPDSQSNEIAVFRFDGILYRQTNQWFSNMRLFDDQSREVPFLVRTVTSDTTVTHDIRVTLKQLTFKKPAGNRMEIVFSRERDDSIPTELNIATPIDNFENTVSVHGSNDQKKWEALAEGCPIYDYSKFISIRNTTVQFKPAACGYYRVTIDKVMHLKQSLFSRVVIETHNATEQKRYNDFIEMQEPFRIDGIAFSGTYREIQYGKPQTKKYALKIERVHEDTAQKATDVYLLSSREPIQELAVWTGSINFIRHAVVEATDDSTKGASWRQLGSNDLYNISIGNYYRKQLAVSLGGAHRFGRYRLTLFNRDNLPIKVDSVSLLGELHEGLFFHRGMKEVSICYGGEKAEAPRYDINDILRSAPVLAGQVWLLGTPIGAEKPASRYSFNTKYLLTGALILMVLVLIGALMVTARKVDEKTGTGDTKNE